ncbi:unnamed protein product [Meloidogyne enterolobii]|uniref:Uncharacterized protein n=1 Tax=Meloidogyne enterolobii TaxID=390850 RepID=A0ACB0Z9F7_MELEN
MSVSGNKLFNSLPENNTKNCHNNILNYFKNGQELLDELTNLASIAYQRCQSRKTKEGKGKDESMCNGEDKIEQVESSDNEADICDATKQRRKALETIAANNKNLPKTIESEQAIKERSERKLDRAKRRAQNSQLVRELRDELEDRPEEIREENPVFGIFLFKDRPVTRGGGGGGEFPPPPPEMGKRKKFGEGLGQKK